MSPRPGVPEYAVQLIREAVDLLDAGETSSKKHGNLESYPKNITAFFSVRGYDISGLEQMIRERRNGISPNDCQQSA